MEREDPTRAGIGAPQSYSYRAEVERCRGREGMHMHMQRGGEGGERATDSASRSRRGC